MILRLPARPLFAQDVIASIHVHAKFFHPNNYYMYISTAKWKNSGVAIATHAFQTDQQSCTITSMVAA